MNGLEITRWARNSQKIEISINLHNPITTLTHSLSLYRINSVNNKKTKLQRKVSFPITLQMMMSEGISRTKMNNLINM